MTRFLDPTLDVVFKLLLGSPETKDCLIALLTAVLMPDSPITDVEVLNPGIDKENIDDKGIVLDLLVRLADGTVTDLEMQVQRHRAFRQRALYYWARSFTSQLERGQSYVKLRPAVLIVFLCYEETESERLHSVYKVLETHDHEPFSEDLAIHFVELPNLGRMTQDEKDAEAELINWARFFAARTDEELAEAAKKDKMVEKTMDYLEKLSEKADVRLLAERREMAHQMYRMELTLAREEGLVQGKRDDLLRVLDRRGIELTETQQAKITSCSDLSLLEQWFDQALTAASVGDIDI
jgi:predicted transposase/invertase (TIGR01784 family)